MRPFFHSLLFIFFILLVVTSQPAAAQEKTLLSYVQPLTGTSSSETGTALKHGKGTEQLANTIPAVTLPFAMTQWTPQTRFTELKCVSPYYYKDSILTGFRGSHWLNGGCAQDYGSVTIMPVMGKLNVDPASYGAIFSHHNETSTASYYSVVLPAYGIKTEMTATARCAIFQFTALRDDSLYLLINPNNDEGEGYVKVDRDRKEIAVCNPVWRIYQFGKPANFSGFFLVQVETAFSASGTYSNNQLHFTDSIMNLPGIGGYVGMKVKKGQVIRVKAAGSFTSIEGARKNLAEIKDWDFTAVRKAASQAWERSLGQVQIGNAAARQKRIFYTALYHAMQHPRLFNDVDGSYPRFAGHHQNEIIKDRNYYDDFSMWDIYRGQLPLLEILQPRLIADFANSMVLKGQQGGWLPNFPLYSSYTGAMVGDHGTAFIASAWLKGITNFDTTEAYRLMRKNAYEVPEESLYKDGAGRRSLASYIKYGYYPLEDSIKDAFHKAEQVSRTLEYAYDDYSLALIAKRTGRQEDFTQLINRAKNYRNVYDRQTGFMNGRHADGSWYAGFNPDIKLPFITEGTSRQYSFYVPQDVNGLSELMGGPASLGKALDSLFSKGEYWHGNEPGHQIPFMYNYIGQAYKTQAAVNRIITDEYSDGPGGLCGNEDAGQISAWYVLATLGFYPVDPASGEYILCTPLFDHSSLQLANGKKFSVNVKRNTPAAIYIRSITWNGKPYTKTFITYADMMKGGVLEITASGQPSVNWGADKKDWPGSISKNNIP